MGKGRYLKAAERACARKARFETAASAEAFVERRYRAYRCVVCGGYHLTSGRGDRDKTSTLPSPKGEDVKGPTLGDLDWSAVLAPKPKKVASPPPTPPQGKGAPSPQPLSPRGARGLCAGACGKDGRVLLIIEGRLVKSKKVESALRPSLTEGVAVETDGGDPPTVLGVSES